jgi:hypothetical protein
MKRVLGRPVANILCDGDIPGPLPDSAEFQEEVLKVVCSNLVSRSVEHLFTPAWKLILLDSTITRRQYFLHIPFLIQEFVNVDDIDALARVVFEMCTENCTFSNRIVRNIAEGRDKLIRMYASLNFSSPDYTMWIKSCRYDSERKEVVFFYNDFGHKMFDHPDEYLYNPVLFTGRGIVDETIFSDVKKFTRLGRRYSIACESKVTLQLTPDASKVCKIYVSTNVVTVDMI